MTASLLSAKVCAEFGVYTLRVLSRQDRQAFNRDAIDSSRRFLTRYTVRDRTFLSTLRTLSSKSLAFSNLHVTKCSFNASSCG